jgi:anti-sigma factor RsiW
MNLSMKNHQTPDPEEGRLLDRLVDGELPDGERRELLLRLENEPDGWRRCALAFLEAQTWREAFRAPVATAPTPPVVPDGPSRKPRSWRPVAVLTGLAASLAAAFALGWVFRGGPEPTAPYPPVAQQATSVPAEPPEPTSPAPIALAAREPGTSKSPEPPGVVDPVVKQWEQRGYHAETQKRLVSLELKDGRKLNVPVQEVRLRYVGDRTY